jgi:hypothetical protein
MRSFVTAAVLSFLVLAPLAAQTAICNGIGSNVDVRCREGNGGILTVQVPVMATPPPGNAPITGDYRTVDGTATAADNDYVPTEGQFRIDIGQSSTIIEVKIFGDLRVEADETFTLEFSNVQGAGTATFENYLFTILNDDVAALTVGSPTVVEGNAGSTALTFPVTLTAPATTPVLATYNTNDGTAVAGQDYQPAAGTLTFAAGQTVQAVTVSVLGDTLFEPDETLTLTVTPAGGVKVTATGTIVNDDVPPPAAVAIVSGNGQSGRLGQQLAQPLVVEVRGVNGQPLAGIPVQWRVTRGTAQLSPASGTTNAQGRASTTVTIESVGAIEVEASAAGLPPVTFTISAATSLEERAEGPVAVPIAHVLDRVCARNESRFAGVCRALEQLPEGALTRALEHVAPQQSGAQSKVAGELGSVVASGVGARLAALRSGTERFSVQQLSFGWNGRSIPLGALANLFFPQSSGSGDSGGEESDYNGWSAFLSGNLGSGERLGRLGRLGFDLKSRGLMAGVDRQFGDSVFGVSVNLMQLDSTLDDSAGSLDVNGYALSLYGSRGGLFGGDASGTGKGSRYDGMHLDGSLTVGRNKYDAEHVVEIGSFTTSRATSSNDADIFAFTGGTGVSGHRGATDFDLSLSGTWSRAQIDDLSEEGSGPLILFVQGHEVESLVGTLGVNIRSARATSFGNLLPSFRVEMVHEFKDGARLVTAHFLRDSLATSFTVPLDQPDANYGRLAAGLQAVFPRGYSAFVEVSQDVLRNDLHFRNVQFNVSKSF